MWPSILTMAMTFTFNFQGKMFSLFYMYLRKNSLIAMKQKTNILIER